MSLSGLQANRAICAGEGLLNHKLHYLLKRASFICVANHNCSQISLNSQIYFNSNGAANIDLFGVDLPTLFLMRVTKLTK